MADNTAIEWTDATWNPITGCSVVSPGCINCYAMKLAGTRLKHHPTRKGLTKDTKAGPVWTGDVRFNEAALDQPLRWKKPRMIFVCAHGDLFAENVPDEWIDRIFAVMALCPQHTFQVLTKRSARMREWAQRNSTGGHVLHLAGELGRPRSGAWPLPNVWLGVSAERQQEAGERIPDLLATPAAIRFVSAEPLIGPIDLTRLRSDIDQLGDRFVLDALSGRLAFGSIAQVPHPEARGEAEPRRVDWVIVGGESGAGARPMHPAWARSIRDQCHAAGTAFFFKQWGEFRPLTEAEHGQACGATLIGNDPHNRDAYVLPATKKRAGRLLDGREHSEFPVQEVPLS